ncbi:MAG: ribosome small subunit-dependent GTPase A [Clostridia bacterium]|nr:ribosome small subunit-dependent GTPase A [Clostridia bacterium]
MILKGTVIRSVGGLFGVRLDSEFVGKTEIEARAKGAFKHEKITLLAGDRVDVDANEHDEFYISKIHERKNSLIRPPLANIDVLFVVISCVRPAPVLETVDKLICIAEKNSIEPVIVITKSDLDKDFAQSTKEIYEKSGFTVFVTSSEDGCGCDELLEYLKKTSRERETIFAFSGASGAGKSTFINKIFPSLQLEVGDLSKKLERGKNTTRKTELFALDKLTGEQSKGYLADTPGFSLLDFERFDFFDLEDLVYTFREFSSSIGKCRYTKCSHTKEEGCDIIARVKSKDIPKSRHESYKALYEVLKNKPRWKK